MTPLNNYKTSTLFRLGAAAIALRSVLQYGLDRAALSNDLTDFALGVLFGIGFGFLLLVIWRKRRGASDGECTL